MGSAVKIKFPSLKSTENIYNFKILLTYDYSVGFQCI